MAADERLPAGNRRRRAALTDLRKRPLHRSGARRLREFDLERRFLLAAGFALLTPALALAQGKDDKRGPEGGGKPEGGGGRPSGGPPQGGGGQRPGGGRPPEGAGQGGPRPQMGQRPAVVNRPAPQGPAPQNRPAQPGFTRPSGNRPSQPGSDRPSGNRPGHDGQFGGNRPSPSGQRPNWGGRPPFGGRPAGQGRPPGFRPIQGRAFRYPRGYGYRRWGIGAALPLLFLSSAYYFNNYSDYGVYAPPYGYRWVRYGPDLLLVQIGTGYVADAIYGAFY